MSNRPMSERIFDMRESGVSTAEIAAFFNLELWYVNNVISRVRKRRVRDAGEAVE